MDVIDVKQPQYDDLNNVLKKMWDLRSRKLTPEEAVYWNTNLHLIQNYYKINSEYWINESRIEYGSYRVKD